MKRYPPLGDGLDVGSLFGAAGEVLAQHRDVVSQVRLFDDRICPQGRQQLFLPQQMAVILNQDHERVEDLRAQRHRLAGA